MEIPSEWFLETAEYIKARIENVPETAIVLGSGLGILSDDIIAYKVIRYSTANRIEYTKLVTSWDGIYDATKYGNCSYQPRAFYNEEDVLEKIQK